MRKLVLLVLTALLAIAATAIAKDRPQTLALPKGWQPEGIAAQGSRLYVGSLANGAVWRTDAKGRNGAILVPGRAGRSAAGLKVSGDRILVSGAGSKAIYVYDRKGRDVTVHAIPDAGFINDVAVLGRSAYFTESQKPLLYVVPRRGGGKVEKLPVTGDFVQQAGFNLNGIVRSGGALIAVQSNTGKLFRIDARTGVAKEIGLGGKDVKNGDGLLLKGRTLYVVENTDNRIAVVRLSQDRTSGTITGYLTDPDFHVPTTLARASGDLFAVNARFDVPDADKPNTAYEIVRVG